MKYEGRDLLTEEVVKALGFVFEDLGDESPYETWTKDSIVIWNYNEEYWIINMLDQQGIDLEVRYIHQLSQFFQGCGLKLQ